jgi:chromosome partitioning protein
MAGMVESCSVCNRDFEVQFRYQMEERDGGFLFFCSQACHGRSVRGGDAGGVVCDACRKRFGVELVSQVVHVKGVRRYACSEPCRAQVLAEAGGAKLAAFTSAPSVPVASSTAPAATTGTTVAAATATTLTTPNVRAIAPTPPPAPVAASVGAPSRKAMHAPRRMAIFNHKGGTGKTTTSVSIAAGLAAQGLRVLLVDTDSQGNVGVSLGVKTEKTLYHVLVMGLKATEAAVNVRPNLDLIVCNETLAAAELYLAGRQNRDRVLRDRLVAAADQYDVILLDCSPSLSLMNQNALVFADGILVPVACDFLSLVGVRQVIKTVKNVNQLLHHPVQIYGVLPTFYDARARICRDAVDTLRQHFAEKCLDPVRQTIKIKEAPAQGRTIYEYAPESNAARDYERVVRRLIDGPAAARPDATDGFDEGSDDADETSSRNRAAGSLADGSMRETG